MVGRKWAEALLNEEELIELVFAWEHWVAIDEFSENATDCPEVDFLAVGCADEELRRAVPASCHIVSKFLLWCLSDGPGKAKVADFELFFVADE